MKAFHATQCGIDDCITFAENAAKARHNVVSSMKEAGFTVTYSDVKIKRLPALDNHPKEKKKWCFCVGFFGVNND